MSVTAIVGANWGDEGKGKMTDVFAASADYVVRYQGGRNAGHTIINEFGKFALHLLPSGVFYPDVVNVIGSGVAFDIDMFFRELDELADRGVPEPKLAVSDRAQVVMPYHPLLDALEEERLGARQFGSTKAGIAPLYADKMLKLGVQTADLPDKERLRERVAASLEAKNVLLRHIYGQPVLDVEEMVDSLTEKVGRLEPYLCDTTALLHKALSEDERVLVEGQLGALRDPDHGIYPYSTSSSTLAGYASVGAGIPPSSIRQVVAVVKAYSTCVGAGPFVSELAGKAAEELRSRGGDAGEFGATTGRPRRVGWFDAVATRYGCRVQGATEIALTNLDVLGYLKEIPVCVAYEVTGERTEDFPVSSRLDAARPVYQMLPGWQQDITGVRRFENLPEPARDYVKAIEHWVGVPVRWISVGPHREQLMEKNN